MSQHPFISKSPCHNYSRARAGAIGLYRVRAISLANELLFFRELAASQDELELVSNQISSRVEAETSELRNSKEMLMLKLQQKEQELSKVSK